MLQLKKINKSYKTSNFTQHVLKDVNINFRKNEFVSILGPSGSGKTTLLNIIGGLDHYDLGDLIINNKSTKKFKSKDWDAYRNNCIGFVFQNYNLINHMTVLDNVLMTLTLSGNKKLKKKKALDVLKKVGLEDHAYKKPNQLSGGQMQRVAIARALVNDPDIVLADEPTGALDSKTSKQIISLIKEIAKEKLVIMVTHNPELAKSYSTRIIELKDGKVTHDSNSYKIKEKDSNHFSIKSTSMNFINALKLSFNNILTKKGRTFITSFASSIGIIGIALVLSLSNGFKIQIDKFEKDTLSQMPIVVSTQTFNTSDKDMINSVTGKKTHVNDTSKNFIYKEKTVESMVHQNNITNDYLNYINKIKKDDISGISYTRSTDLNMYVKNNDKYQKIDSSRLFQLPEKISNDGFSNVITDNFDLIYGKLPEDKNELLLIINDNNELDEEILKILNLNEEKISFDQILNKEFYLVLNNDYYKSYNKRYIINDVESIINENKSLNLKITGIIRGKKDNDFAALSGSGIVLKKSLYDYVINENKNSNIVVDQRNLNYNILTHEEFNNDDITKSKNTTLAYLGDDIAPNVISIYPKDFNAKENIVSYLDKYNKNKSKKDKIIYNDYAKTITSLSNNIMNAITIVLLAFSAISLIVSSIMIGIITYISVLERTKEIGILRSLGARKKDISRVFNAETFIIGLFSGTMGIIITYILNIPINKIVLKLTKLENVARLNLGHAILLILVSLTLTLIGGLIPARIASKKDPVEALRSE